MKKLFTVIFGLSFIFSNAQEPEEKKITTQISEVTVFVKDAQVTRKKTIEVNKGITVLKFIDLSPFIVAKSIQVKANGNVTVLAVNHQQNFLEQKEKEKNVEKLDESFLEIEEKIKLEQTHLTIIKEELSFLEANKNINGKDQEISLNNLKEVAAFYNQKITELKLKEITRNATIKELIKQREKISKERSTLTTKKEYPKGEILVKIDAKVTASIPFELSYLVTNCSWFPTYDLRAKNINEPIEVVYKANIKQDTQVDWNNVKLRLSTADPNVSGVVPELQVYKLDYFTAPPSYRLTSNEIKGRVFDQDNIPLPGVYVVVEGTTIGTTTDFDGGFTITVPNQLSKLHFSSIGFKDQILPVSDALQVVLEENQMKLEEVVVTSYSNNGDDIRDKEYSSELLGRVKGVQINTRSTLKTKQAIPINQQVKQTAVDFEIAIPYTVKSDNKSYTAEIAQYKLPADYTYFSIPKINKEAYLLAYITDWEKYNFLEGEANIFFEDTYIGKTLMDTRKASDTLQISLGRDKNVSITRETVKNFTTKQFIGSKKEESRIWNTSIKNNKNEKIKLLVYDQVPVSSLEEIKVEVLNLSNGKQNTESGEVKWELEINPKESKKIELHYTVKYPKNKQLLIE